MSQAQLISFSSFCSSLCLLWCCALISGPLAYWVSTLPWATSQPSDFWKSGLVLPFLLKMTSARTFHLIMESDSFKVSWTRCEGPDLPRSDGDPWTCTIFTYWEVLVTSLTSIPLFILSAFWFIIISSDHIHAHSYRLAHIICFVLLHLEAVLKITLEYSRASLPRSNITAQWQYYNWSKQKSTLFVPWMDRRYTLYSSLVVDGGSVPHAG